MFPEGYIMCKEIQWGKETYIIYFHVLEDSKDMVSVYLTNSNVVLLAKVPIDELRRVASAVDVTKDVEIMSVLRLSIQQEVLHCDLLQSEVTLPVNHGGKSSKLLIKLNAISNDEEKGKYLKFLLFQLAKIAENKCDLPYFGKTQHTTPINQGSVCGHTSSLQSHKIASKRRGPGMSIVNPGSKRVHNKQGVQYEEEDSDN